MYVCDDPCSTGYTHYMYTIYNFETVRLKLVHAFTRASFRSFAPVCLDQAARKTRPYR